MLSSWDCGKDDGHELNTCDEVTTNPEPTDFYSSVATPFPQGLAALFLPDRTKVPVFLVERMVFSVLLAEWASPATSVKFSLCQRQRGRFSRSPLGGGENTFQERFLSALDSGFVCVFVLSCRLQFFFQFSASLQRTQRARVGTLICCYRSLATRPWQREVYGRPNNASLHCVRSHSNAA
ncbi:hypothetical protein NDU88_003415 [Pleurodeles waltl]|uniref:Uncharacterized protein n=1 Tax=Pleurodeles waltl TaxID=8319 RepID=A0AAV7QBN0_PLEWA|nr:hypothetical protein NDU88_003415 [Pleurodeles waltl]